MKMSLAFQKKKKCSRRFGYKLRVLFYLKKNEIKLKKNINFCLLF